MSKTVAIPDEIHTLVVDKQLEIRRKYKITVKISDLIAVIVKNNIDNAGKYLGLKGEIGELSIQDGDGKVNA